MRKIPTQLCGTNFCTSSARFAPSFVSQPNGPKCTNIVRNAPKHEFSVQWGGMGAFVEKNSDTASWHKLLHHYERFAPSFIRQPNGPNCTKIVRNAPKHVFRVQWDGSRELVAKNSDATLWHELLDQFGPFCTEFRKSTKWSQMHQIIRTHQNMNLGSNGVDRVRSLRKIPTRLRGMNFCTITTVLHRVL